MYQHAEALRQPPASPASFDWLRPGVPPNPIGHYYFSSIPLGPNNTNDLFVVLTFSGGGTRAAALAYGVLDELRRIKVDCADPGRPATCSAKTLLDEVDVISSVSGGSLTAAYYARYGDDIFLPSSDFQKRFLQTNAERELFGEAVYFPQNWLKLLGRPEIAADLWSSHLFHNSTFADLTKRPRPYLILNASDYLSESRFQFTQDQFDLLCDDLNSFPLSRAVAASSAFPGLLNSMTLNTHNQPHECSVARPEPQWVTSARLNQFENRPDYRDTLVYDQFTSPDERYLHLLDGGLTDNLGLRPVLAGLNGEAGATLPLLSLGNLGATSRMLVIVVNARTGGQTKLVQPNHLPVGPVTLPVIGSTSSMPMGTVSYDSVDMLTQFVDVWQQNRRVEGLPKMDLYAVELTFENIPNDSGDSTPSATRNFFRQLPTDFALPPSTVDCLDVEGRLLLQRAASYGGYATSPSSGPRTFAGYVTESLHGYMPPEAQHVIVKNNACQVR